MVRHHSTSCDCERCRPSEEVLHFLEKNTKKPSSSDALYARRKWQERRVAEELRKWSQAVEPAELRLSSETLTVVRNILRRFKEYLGIFFTHPEIQIILLWHMCQAVAGESIDAALAMMVTGVLTPYVNNIVLQTRATEKLKGERGHIDHVRADAYHGLARLLVANGAKIRMSEALVHGTMFHFDSSSNIAIAQKPPPSISPSTSPSRETSNEGSVDNPQSLVVREEACSASASTSPFRETSNEGFVETTQCLVVLEDASPSPENVMENSETDIRLEQLEQENDLLTERVYYLEDERAQLEEDWEVMERKLRESEAENRRLKKVLQESLQIFAEPWDALKDRLEN